MRRIPWLVRLMRRVIVVIVLTTLLLACKQQYAVGEQVLVQWEGNVYPAKILAAVGPTKYKVHYDGYDSIWDEVVPRERVKGYVEGNVIHPEPPAKVRAKAVNLTSVYKIGDRVRVEWHGQLYPAMITAIVGQDLYRIHYEGYGPEWDEQVGLSRIQPK